MSNQNALTLTIDEQQVAWLAIDLPNEKMNTLRAEFSDDMTQIFATLETHKSELKGLIVHSLKADNFIAGADIHMLEQCKTAEEAALLAKQGQDVFKQLSELPFTTVSAIHGACLGGGLEFALACDYRVCSDDDNTRLALPEVQLGLLPGSGGTQRLPRLIGLTAALDMMLTGRAIRAKKAKKMGLADACVPRSILHEVAKIWIAKPKRNQESKLGYKEWLLAGNGAGRKLVFDQAAKTAQAKARGNYPAIAAILSVCQYGLEHGVEKGSEKEVEAFGELVMTSQSKALRSLFFATTEMKKQWQPTNKKETHQKINNVGVLGGGLMGAGIAHVSAEKAGARAHIKDVTHEAVLHGLSYNHAIYQKQKSRKILTFVQAQRKMQAFTGGIDYHRFSKMDLVIEAVFEDLNLKQQMVADIEENCPPSTIFATNTSSLPIAQIAQNAQRPENIIGLHYFSPVEKMPLVEVIPHENTAHSCIERMVGFARKQGKTPIVVKDKAGFYANRILAPYLNEAATLLLSGEPIDHIDEALMDAGFPVGPFGLLDAVGVDVAAKIIPILIKELGERFTAPDMFDLLVKDKRLGQKSGKGFYEQDSTKKGKKKQVDKSVYALFNVTEQADLSAEIIANRCMLMMLNEAVRAFDDGIISSVQDGDIGAIFGLGFPPFLGGPFRYMDQMGLSNVVALMQEYQQQYGDKFAPCEALLKRAENGGCWYVCPK